MENEAASSNSRGEDVFAQLWAALQERDEERKKSNIESLKDALYAELLIANDAVPESYFDLQMRIAEERGERLTYLATHVRVRLVRTLIEDQRTSLDAWISYVTANDAQYPDWYAFLIFIAITRISKLDTETGVFRARTRTTVAPFPDIYAEPLALMLEEFADRAPQITEQLPYILPSIAKEFAASYASHILQLSAEQASHAEGTDGEWKTYTQSNEDDLVMLVESLRGKGTGWCTAAVSTARMQLQVGDFHVYYTYDAAGKASVPRIAIRMDWNAIAEIRGVLPQQELEPVLSGVLDAKLAEFGQEADEYKKKIHDMKQLTHIQDKTNRGDELTAEELTFLYEIHQPILGFGYGRDPRIQALRSARDVQADAPVILGYSADEVAWSPEEVTGRTQAYIGPFFPGIFSRGIPTILRKFPDTHPPFMDIVLGGKTKQELLHELADKGIQVTSGAQKIIDSQEFAVSEEQMPIRLVIVKPVDIGITTAIRTDELFAHAQEYDLKLCPPEVVLPLALAPFQDQICVASQLLESCAKNALLGVNYQFIEITITSLEGRWGSNQSFAFALLS